MTSNTTNQSRTVENRAEGKAQETKLNENKTADLKEFKDAREFVDAKEFKDAPEFKDDDGPNEPKPPDGRPPRTGRLSRFRMPESSLSNSPSEFVRRPPRRSRIQQLRDQEDGGKMPNGMKILKRLALMMPSSNYGGDTKFSSFFEEEDDDEDDQTHLEVQRQAASALLSIASRSSTVDHVTDIGGLQLFTELQNSGDVRLANIARDGLRYLSSSKQQTHY